MSEERAGIVIGTRGSALALAQAELTEAALREAHPEITLRRSVIKTTGDRRTDVPLADVAAAEGHLEKGVFIKELELALEAGEIDVAVHSLKDMPSELEEGFVLAAILPRAPIADVLVSKTAGGLSGLPEGATVATSSVRRQRLVQWLRPDLKLADIRGNVPTRIRKLHESDAFDAVLLAQAGLERLHLLQDDRVVSEEYEAFAAVLDPAEFLPAAGQGAVALEVRAGEEETIRRLAPLNHRETADQVTLERKFLALLGAGCDTPVGVWTQINGETIDARALVFEDGEESPLQSSGSSSRENLSELAKELVEGLKRS